MLATDRRQLSEGVVTGSLFEDRLVEDLMLLREVLAACAASDERRLADLGVRSQADTDSTPMKRKVLECSP